MLYCNSVDEISLHFVGFTFLFNFQTILLFYFRPKCLQRVYSIQFTMALVGIILYEGFG